MSETMKHTPGPWIIKRLAHSHRQTVRIIEKAKHGAIAEIKDAYHDSEGQANAALIAAAPEMIEVIKELRERLAAWMEISDKDDARTYDQDAINQADAILARIE